MQNSKTQNNKRKMERLVNFFDSEDTNNIDSTCYEYGDYTFIGGNDNKKSEHTWIIPLTFPTVDIEVRKVSIASWLVIPISDWPLTEINWSFAFRRPSCDRDKVF